MSRRLSPAVGVSVAAALLVAGCGSTSSGGGSASSSGDRSGPVADPPHVSVSGSIDSSPNDEPVGSPDHPVAVTAGQAPLSWRRVPGPTDALVTVGEGWTLTVPQGGAEARLVGRRTVTVPAAGAHGVVHDAFLDADHALVVSEDRLAHDPDVATLVDLATGRRTTLDAGSSPPTAVGGAWALGPDSVLHATEASGQRYCVATVDLADGSGSTGWCAPRRHGFSRATVTADGTTMMTFDDHHPSCRTLTVVDGSRLTPLPGVTPCKGWDSALLPGSTTWSVVPKDRRIEAAHFYAHTEGGWFDLGPGTSGSLVTCAGSAYFTRDPDSRSDPAELLRWEPDTASLSVAYRSRATGNAFLSPPRCGGTHLTLTAYSDSGDQQVTADLG